ncbi:MAG: hypothetical protein WCO68_04185 [Verrucomicrobiota bacterium]
MNKFTFSALAAVAVAGSAFASPATVVASKDFKQPAAPQFFKDTELAIDAFYSYTDAQHRNALYFTDGNGGGVGVNYFCQRYFGVDVEGNWWKGNQPNKNDKDVVSQATANLIVRYPMEFTSFGVAPYLLGGGGVLFSGQNCGFSDVGAGVEFRVTPQVGIFSDWRWNFITGGNRNDVSTTRAGIRFVF